jgi:hypothetical protein
MSPTNTKVTQVVGMGLAYAVLEVVSRRCAYVKTDGRVEEI